MPTTSSYERRLDRIGESLVRRKKGARDRALDERHRKVSTLAVELIERPDWPEIKAELRRRLEQLAEQGLVERKVIS